MDHARSRLGWVRVRQAKAFGLLAGWLLSVAVVVGGSWLALGAASRQLGMVVASDFRSRSGMDGASAGEEGSVVGPFGGLEGRGPTEIQLRRPESAGPPWADHRTASTGVPGWAATAEGESGSWPRTGTDDAVSSPVVAGTAAGSDRGGGGGQGDDQGDGQGNNRRAPSDQAGEDRPRARPALRGRLVGLPRPVWLSLR
jgi:hypothetical protein